LLLPGSTVAQKSDQGDTENHAVVGFGAFFWSFFGRSKKGRNNATIKFVLLHFFILICIAVHAQPYNRIQYRTLHWRAFHTSAFHIYFPQGNDSLCAFIAHEYADAEKRIKQRMGTSLSEVPNIILYPSINQQYETNIGSSEPKDITLPTFVIKGNRMLLYFNGSYEGLKDQLYEAIVRSIWEQQNNNLADQAAGTTQQEQIPYWFKEGAIRYIAHQWSVAAEDALHWSCNNHTYSNWEEVIARQPALAGQAFCYFLTEQFLPTAIMQTYLQIRKRKTLPAALRLITKTRIDSLYTQCFHYYQNRFLSNADSVKSVVAGIALPHKNGAIVQVLLSPDGKTVAYTIATPHKRTVYTCQLSNLSTDQLTTYNLPPWITDHSGDPYPLIAWAQNGKDLLVTMPVKGKICTKLYSIAGTQLDQYKLEAADGIQMLLPFTNNIFTMAAWRQGELDLVDYNTRKNKYYLDQQYDVDYYRFTVQQNSSDKALFQLLPTRPLIQKDTALVFDSTGYTHYDHFTYLQDGRLLFAGTQTGAEKWYLAKNADDMTTATPLCLYEPLQYLSQSSKIVTWKATADSLFIRQQKADDWIRDHESNDTAAAPWLADYRNLAAIRAKEDSILKAAKDETPGFLDGVFNSKNNKEQAQKRQDSIKRSLEYSPKKTQPYVLQFHSAYFSAKVNNDYYINRYQPYLNYQGQFKFPEVGGMAQGGFSDLFGNHHFTIAYRMPAGTEGSDFFVKYRNTAKKLDWGLTYFRKIESLQPDPKRNWTDDEGRLYPNAAKVKTNYYEVSLHYPLSWYSSLNFTTALRNDRTIFLATETYSLKFAPIQSNWSISSLGYEINKLRPALRLLYRGFSAKATIDLFKGFSQKEQTLTGNTLQLTYHQPLYKYITLVTKLQAGYSGGDARVLYNLGGVDKNLSPRVDSNVHFPQDAPYAFTTLVTPFRGYFQNSLYGNEYALLNVDIYFPIFQTLISIETPLSSINNLQLGVFTDIATAKETWRKPAINNGPKSAYGFSARTTLAGYPLRFDMAWPGEGGKPVWYLGLSVK
jgi:hypothetical protein